MPKYKRLSSIDFEALATLGHGQLIKFDDVLKFVPVSSRTLRRWIKERRIPYLRVGPRNIFFKPAAVLKALEKFEVKERSR